MNIDTNNIVTLCGKINGNFRYSHNVKTEQFYTGTIETIRTSGVIDRIPFLVSEYLVDVNADWDGVYIKIQGSFRSRNAHIDGRHKVELNVFAEDIELISEQEIDCSTNNMITLDGFICKEPVYRETPTGKKITDITIAVNRLSGISDYIPCICWNKTAKYSAVLSVGTHILVKGRIQSREYSKTLHDNTRIIKMAYEMSVVYFTEIK